MFQSPLSLRIFNLLLPVMVAPLLAAGCGNDLTDGDFGGVDLLPFFYDSSSQKPPAAYDTKPGYQDDLPVRYFDFGWSATFKDTPDEARRNALGLEVGERIPKVAPVNPMYFFFDSRGNPMFAPPVKEARSGAFSMPGGSGVRDVNPAPDAKRDVAYPVRTRNLLTDSLRKTADYQRPIIDVIYDREEEEAQQKYSGLWEFVKVTAPSGYQPDEIKSWATLEKGIEAGDFKVQTSSVTDSTELLAINCPIIDSRSLVIPNISAYVPGEPRIPQPLVELWYRRKRINCFLVNGWETLGKTQPSPDGADKYVLYKASEDNLRISTLDTSVTVLGSGTAAAKRILVAPVSELYIPKVSARDESFYINDAFLTAGALPRRTKADPPGYRPVRWWWDISVTDFGSQFTTAGEGSTLFRSGLTNLKNIDDSKLSPRGGTVINFPLTSSRIPCKGATPGDDPCAPLGLVCGRLATSQTDFCEVPLVRYGATCAPTIADCRGAVDDGKGSGEPDVVELWFVSGEKATRPDDQKIIAAAGVPQDWIDAQAAALANKAGASRIVRPKDAKPYACLSGDVSKIGACYLSCNGSNANTLQNTFAEEEIALDGDRKASVKYPLDSRCGGKLMPGFRCLPVTDQTADKGGSYCLRDCNPGAGKEFSDALCRRPTPTYFSSKLIGYDIGRDTSCLSNNVVDENDRTVVTTTFGACVLDPSFAPFPDR